MNKVDPKRTALLLMDFQNQIAGMMGDAIQAPVEQARALLEKARNGKMLVVYIVVGFRPGYPEANSRDASHAMIKKSGGFVGVGAADVLPALQPRPEEAVIVKRRVSAFFGTELDLILRANAVDTLILAGVATSGVVLSTARYARDADYEVVIAKDACADRDEEVHRVLLEKIFARHCTVLPASEICEAITAAP